MVAIWHKIMARIKTKIGDVFVVKINATHKRYLQLVAFDLLQLNSDVIRAFKEEYPIDSMPLVADIIKGQIDFYAHCATDVGLKMQFWERVGSIKEVGDLSQVLFKGTNDYGLNIGEEPAKVSYNWYVWRIGDESFTKVGKLEGENRKAYIGLIINPLGIIELLKGNKYPIHYPDF
jgi:hypothetical protein